MNSFYFPCLNVYIIIIGNIIIIWLTVIYWVILYNIIYITCHSSCLYFLYIFEILIHIHIHIKIIYINLNS